MTYPVTISAAPLVPDTLPTLKTRHYTGAAAAKTYTLARFYALHKSLAVTLYAFEREPPDESRVSLLLGGGQGTLLRLTVGPRHSGVAGVFYQSSAEPVYPLPQEAVPAAEPFAHTWFAGVDEQGWFWGVDALLDEKLLRRAGIVVQPGAVLQAGVLRHVQGQGDWGASFPLPQGRAPVISDMGTAVFVTY